MFIIRRSKQARQQRGVAALEFALIIPVLMLVLYGIVMLAFIMVARGALSHAASEGARVAIAEPPSGFTRPQIATNVCNAAIDWLVQTVGSAHASCQATLSEPCAANNPNACIKVSATYLYGTKPLIPALPLVSSFVPAQLNASAVAQIGYLSQ